MRIPLWSRLRLAPRIALVVVGSLLAVKVTDEAMPLVIRPPEIMFFQRDWLVDTLREIRDRSIAVPAPERPAVLQNLPSRRWLDVTLQDARPDIGEAERTGGFAALHQQIANTLGLAPQDVVLRADELGDPAQALRPVVIILPDLPTVMVDVFDEHSSNMMTSDLRIGFRIGSGAWLVVTPRSDGNEAVRMIRNVLFPLSAVVVIAVISIWVARGVARPLDDLAAAAEKLGRDRELSLVGGFNAPELQAIGETFNAMQLRLKQFVDERLQMIAAISHNLRTPLTR